MRSPAKYTPSELHALQRCQPVKPTGTVKIDRRQPMTADGRRWFR